MVGENSVGLQQEVAGATRKLTVQIVAAHVATRMLQ
jgi:hypothetical protein